MNIFYRVQKNDNLTKIARIFDVPPFSIIKNNNLTCELEEGDIICICKSNKKTYTIEVNDTYEKISKRFNISVTELKEINNLPYLIVGTKIYIE